MTICAHCQVVSCKLSVSDSQWFCRLHLVAVNLITQILVLGMESEFSEPEVDSQEEIQETREAGCTPKPKPGSCMCASTSVIYDSHSDVSEDA